MYKLTETAKNNVGKQVDVTVPVSFLNRTKKTVQRTLHKRTAFGMELLYINYDGLQLFVKESKGIYIVE